MRTKPPIWSIAGVFLVLSWGTAGAQRPAGEAESATPCLILPVSSPEQPAGARGSDFSATEILDLELRVLLPGSISGEHRLDLKLYTPNDHLYQVLTVPFRTGSRPARAESRRVRRLSDYPHPVPESRSKPVRYRQHAYEMVSAHLPVAGTAIVWSSLYGAWRVEAHLDESPVSCGRAREFTIRE